MSGNTTTYSSTCRKKRDDESFYLSGIGSSVSENQLLSITTYLRNFFISYLFYLLFMLFILCILFIYFFIYFIRSFVRSFDCSFVRSFIHSLIQKLSREINPTTPSSLLKRNIKS